MTTTSADRHYQRQHYLELELARRRRRDGYLQLTHKPGNRLEARHVAAVLAYIRRGAPNRPLVVDRGEVA